MPKHILKYSQMPNTRPYFQNMLPDEKRRYYSSQDALVYFGNLLIEEIAAIDFTVTESTLLLYGYNSYIFDEVAKGSRMIQGSFRINFTQTNYLMSVLNEIQGMEHYSTRFTPIWPKGFDLYIYYGEDDHTQVLRLEEVVLTDSGMQLDAKTGESVAEIYKFVARDIHYNAQPPQPVLPPETEESEKVTLKVEKAYYRDQIIWIRLSPDIVYDKVTVAFNEPRIFKSCHIPLLNEPIQVFVDQGIYDQWQLNDNGVIYLQVKGKLDDQPIEQTLRIEVHAQPGMETQ